MSTLFIGLLVLLIFMIIASLIAVETGDLLSSVVCVGAAGFGLALIDLLLKAPDLAITQMVVEILCVVFLIRVVIVRRDTTHEETSDTLTTGTVAVCLGLFLAAVYACIKELHAFGQPLFGQHQAGATMADQYVQGGLAETGATNYVMSVLLDFRAYDTLGEATVIFVSVIGAYAVLRRIGRTRDVASS